MTQSSVAEEKEVISAFSDYVDNPLCMAARAVLSTSLQRAVEASLRVDLYWSKGLPLRAIARATCRIWSKPAA